MRSWWVAISIILIVGLSGCVSNEDPQAGSLEGAPVSEFSPEPGEAHGKEMASAHRGDPRQVAGSEGAEADANGTRFDAAPPEVRVESSHSHAELLTVGPVELEAASVEPVDRSWSRPVDMTNDTLTLVPFLEPERSYRISYTAVLENGTVWDNQTIIQTKRAPSSFSSPERARIHPGMEIVMGGPEGPAACSLNFVLRGPTNETLYALTAGHCVMEIENQNATRGQGIYFSAGNSSHELEPGERFGTVERAVVGREPVYDWALVKIHEEYRHQVSPTLPQWGGPTGLGTGPYDVTDPVCFYGYGLLFQATEPTRGRCGALAWFYPPPPEGGGHSLVLGGPAVWGDSGAPLIHIETGEALGYVTGGGNAAFTSKTLCYTIGVIEEKTGFMVRLIPGEPADVDVPEIPGAGLEDLPAADVDLSCPDDVIALHQEV